MKDSTGTTARSCELNRVNIKFYKYWLKYILYDIIASKDTIMELDSYSIDSGFTEEKSKDTIFMRLHLMTLGMFI
jgi:hypothetical protein